MCAKRSINYTEALEKAQKLCAIEERCRYDVRKKLFDWGANSGDTEKIINQLIDQKYLDEWRFARMFAGGKFRNNKWGKVKISYELIRKNISEKIIEDALRRIDETEYVEILKKELLKKRKSINVDDNFKLKIKLHRYASSKGFETDIINNVLDDMIVISDS